MTICVHPLVAPAQGFPLQALTLHINTMVISIPITGTHIRVAGSLLRLLNWEAVYQVRGQNFPQNGTAISLTG